MRAGFWQRAVGWTLDAALLAPVALVLAIPWLIPAAREVQARWQALAHYTGRRMAAAIVDGVPLPQLAVELIHDPGLGATGAALQAAIWSLCWPPVLAFAALALPWQVGFECSRWQASPGRRVLGLRVVDRSGRRAGPGRVLLRHVSAALSWATLNIGHLMAANGLAHLALHDRISGTRVQARQRRLPRWAAAWLILQVTALSAALPWLAVCAGADLAAALERALF